MREEGKPQKPDLPEIPSRPLVTGKSQAGFVPFNRPTVVGSEQKYVEEVLQDGKLAGGGPFTARCNDWLQQRFTAAVALTTTSCTHALEMAAILCELQPGDEVIMPSFAFSSTAIAFVRCGASLVFVDLEPATMNIDPAAVEAAITPRTRVIVALDYAGVPCDYDRLRAIARRHDLFLVEDAAQAILAVYRDTPCGAIGTFGCFSFHETKNLQCGEGGALIVTDPRFAERAEVVREMGTDRARFMRGEVERYTWRDIGSSFVLGELNAAFLLAQLERAEEVTAERLRAWHGYHRELAPLCDDRCIKIPEPPAGCQHNGHIFWIKTRDAAEQAALIRFLREQSIHAAFHYQPLHSTPAGRRFGRFAGQDRWTSKEAHRLVRLPLYYRFDQTARVAAAIRTFYAS